MPLEVATYINGLVATNPPDGDPRAEGNDHLQLIKSTLKNTFPNITGPVVAPQAALNLLAGFSAAHILAALDADRTLQQPVGWRMLAAGVTSALTVNYGSYNLFECQVNSGPLTITVSGAKSAGRRASIVVNNNTGGSLTVNWSGLGAAQYIPSSARATSIPTGFTLFEIILNGSVEIITVLNATTLG